MKSVFSLVRGYSSSERLKALILCAWFFFTITTLWLLKPIRTAALLTHLGAVELPYVRFGAVLVVGVVVLVYSRYVDSFTRLQLARGGNLCFALVLVLFWALMQLGGDVLGKQRWFVWAVFILVDVYATVMVAVFWTYTNDVMSRAEADRLYGPIGVGGILGGVAGGVMVDGLVATFGQVNLLLLCAGLVAACAALAVVSERVLKPPARQLAPARIGGLAVALEGGRLVLHNKYLLLLLGIVVGYEFAAALGEFVINVVFERSFHGSTQIAKMYGRLGWMVSLTALCSQLLLVPLVLPHKRAALLLSPLSMAIATCALAGWPVVALAFLLAAADRGLNYSLQQVTKETLYVPLGDTERYKAKAFIDMFIDRAAKALSSVALIVVLVSAGVSIRATLALLLVSIGVWALCASALGRAYVRCVSLKPSAGHSAPPPTANEQPVPR